jgi:hypothetical protein
MRIWSAESLHEFVETPLHPQKIGIWLAVSRRWIIGPIFFNQTNRNSCKISQWFIRTPSQWVTWRWTYRRVFSPRYYYRTFRSSNHCLFERILWHPIGGISCKVSRSYNNGLLYLFTRFLDAHVTLSKNFVNYYRFFC